MTSEKKLWVALVAVAILAIGGYFYPQVKASFGAISTQDGSATAYTQLAVTNGVFISGGGLVNTNGCQSNGGVTTCTVRQSLVSGTSTPCAIQNPFTATSTIVSFVMNISTATSSAITWAIGTSTTAYATSTSMLNPSIAASALSTQSYIGGNNNNQIVGSSYVLVGAGAGTATASGAYGTGIVIGGTCQATFQTTI